MTDYKDDTRRRNPGAQDSDRPLPVERTRLRAGSNAMWAWIGGAVVIAVILILIFGYSGNTEKTAGDGASPPAATTQAPGSGARTTTGQGSPSAPATPPAKGSSQ